MTGTMLSLSEADNLIPSSGRQMLDHVNRLHSTGVQIDIDLPQIAVVGTQSVGKTSLIESITGISLPRESGTCTRCPIECRLAHSDANWSCVVSLRITEHGQARNIPFGDIILDPKDVEKRVRKAQKAILNPSQPVTAFLNEDADLKAVNEERFSSNTICLQITGPNLTDLSFCDLPGLIASVSMDGDAQDIKLVDDLVRSYIMKPSCIILLAVSCETDFENQKAHQLVHEVDPERARTIGVLTKPDRIQKLEEGQWLRLLRNEKEELAYGWYVVKLPTSADMREGITWAEARADETRFFDNTYPWPDEASTHLGTPNLIVQLEAVLSGLIIKRLPEIEKELSESISRTQRRLADLPPPPPEHPFLEINHQLGAFCAEVQSCVDGKSSPAGEIALQQTIRPRFQRFKSCLLKTAPRFLPWDRAVSPTTHFSFNPPNQQVERLARPVYLDEVYTKAQEERIRELPGMMSFDVYMHYINEFLAGWPDPTHELAQEVAADVSRIVRKLVKQRFAGVGHGALQYRVGNVMQETVKKRSAETLEALNELLERAKTPHTLLEAQYTFYREGLEQYYRQAYESPPDPTLALTVPAPAPAASMPTPISGSATPASQPPPAFPPTANSGFTFGKPKPNDSTSKEVADAGKQAASKGTFGSASTPVVKLPAEKPASGFFGSTSSATSGSTPSPFGNTSSAFKMASMSPGPFGGPTGSTSPAPSTPAPSAPTLAPNVLSAEMSTALGVMAHVRAYFEIAYKRYLDNVHEIVDYKLVRGVARELLPSLCRGLGIDGRDAQKVCASLTAEREDVRVRREELRKKLERLEAASQELAAYR
uniref:GED domain-containing protein n=1 Tax=Schizophyllum commune (strain H4-8 / FGSC 9210) TaxID=578458 RepID=D8QJM5_SCHCM